MKLLLVFLVFFLCSYYSNAQMQEEGTTTTSVIEDQGDLPIDDFVDNMRLPFGHFIDLFNVKPLIAQVFLGARCRHHFETLRDQMLHCGHDLGFVGILDRDKHRPLTRQGHACAQLRFEEGGLEIAVDPHHLAG